MKIRLNAIFVSDQDAALTFYTDVLGFVKKHDIPIGGPVRWLTVVSADEPDGTEVVLEPNMNPAALTYQQSLREQGIPITAFLVDDIQREYERLTSLGVTFKRPPTPAGPVTIAILDDTVGNWIQLYQVLGQ